MTKFINAVEEIYSEVSQNKSKLQLSKIKKLSGKSTTIKAVSERDTTVNTIVLAQKMKQWLKRQTRVSKALQRLDLTFDNVFSIAVSSF